MEVKKAAGKQELCEHKEKDEEGKCLLLSTRNSARLGTHSNGSSSMIVLRSFFAMICSLRSFYRRKQHKCRYVHALTKLRLKISNVLAPSDNRARQEFCCFRVLLYIVRLQLTLHLLLAGLGYECSRNGVVLHKGWRKQHG